MYYYDPYFRQMSYPYYPYGMYPQTGLAQPGMPLPDLTPETSPFAYPQLPAGPPTPTVPVPSGAAIPLPMAPDQPAVPTAEESYIENILRFNRGKIGTFRFTFENNPQWNALEVRGRIETAGRDHLILSDPRTGKRYLMQMVNFDYADFDEPLAYIPPAFPPTVPLTTGVTRDVIE